MKNWGLILRSSTRLEFEANWTAFQKDHPPPLVKYVQDTWIVPHKERIIWAWIDQHPHFDH